MGLRSDRSDYTLLRRLVSWTNIHLIQTLFGMKLRQFQYISMYRMEVLRGMQIEYSRSAFFLAEVLIKARDSGWRLVEVEIRYAPRLSGKPTGAKFKLVVLTVMRYLPLLAALGASQATGELQAQADMKAILFHKHGGPEVLEYTEFPDARARRRGRCWCG